MKKVTLTLFCLVTVAASWAANVNVESPDEIAYVDIGVEEAAQLLIGSQDVTILDVRTRVEYESGHIAGAISIPLSELEGRIDELDRDAAIIVNCKSGVRSRNASSILVNHGLENVCNMLGGINAWVDAGFSVMSDSIAEQYTNDSLSSEIDGILSSGKPVFLFFHVDCCYSCQEQKPIIDELEQEYAGRIVFIRVNGEEYPEAMREFGANGYPSMFLITGKEDDGQYESQCFRGFTAKETLKKSIDWIITNRGIAGSISLSVLSGFVGASATPRFPHNSPCFPDDCRPDDDGCIGPSYPCTTDADCSDDGWYCCGPKATENPLEETFYRDYFCNASNQCDYNITGSVDCDAFDDKWCEGDIRKRKGCTCRDGDINVTCYCIITSKDCNDYDGCYAYDFGCEDRDYYCDNGYCEYTYSNRQTDYREDWIYYCKEDEVWRKRLFHDFYCDGGTCTDHTGWVHQWWENCYIKDGWYPDGANAEEYRDYRCSVGICVYDVTDHRCNDGYGNCNGDWSDGCEVNLNTDPNNCGSCGHVCGAGESCVGGTCQEAVPEFPLASAMYIAAIPLLFYIWWRRKHRKLQ